MKDLKCPKYWARFGELGPNIGRAFMPTPQEAADTVIGLMQENERLRQQVRQAESGWRSATSNFRDFFVRLANDADAIRDQFKFQEDA